MSEKRPFYELPLSLPVNEGDAVRVMGDIAYLEDDDPDARMDIYLPTSEAPEGGFVPLLLLHGGPLAASANVPLPKEWRVFQDYGRLAAAHGLAGVVINHRYFGYEGLPQAAADVEGAIKFLAQNGEAYHLAGRKLAVWLFSGAGMLMNVLLSSDIKTPDCLVAFYPLLDLTHIPQAAEVFDDNQLMALSPLSQLDRMPPAMPMFFARAGLDRPGLNRALDTFVKQALYHNLDLELRNLPHAQHGFDMFNQSAEVQGAIARGFEFVKEVSSFVS